MAHINIPKVHEIKKFNLLFCTKTWLSLIIFRHPPVLFGYLLLTFNFA